MVTLLVMRIFSSFLGASRACTGFRDSAAESRFKDCIAIFIFGTLPCIL
ncbi:MAG: hypothetical protein OFPII_05750 [Osedax symbiont Rs1]|nr:MAG: hypothetical protein OFPII_05750 [Osedax symbiont Rs1]